jgi:hypothetical protein
VPQLTETLLFWNVVDTDARDIVDDFRLTLPATQAAHDRFAADNDLYGSAGPFAALRACVVHGEPYGEPMGNRFQFSLLMETPLQTIELVPTISPPSPSHPLPFPGPADALHPIKPS